MKLSAFIVTLCLFLANCERDKYVERIGMVQIENFNIADTVLQNENVPITIKASANNGCWRDLFVEFKKVNPFEYSVKSFGTFSCYEGGCACPAVMVYHDTIIDFLPNQKGTYIIQFEKYLNTIVTDTLIVR